MQIALSVALGFDSYVVIRHGIAADCPLPPRRAPDLSHALNVAGCDLACYFCNDVTAPGDSSRDRTLDQQCTVSRAGLSQIAAGTAVELFASVLQHDDGAMAAAPIGELEDGIGGVLGATPHQIRGFLSRFHQVPPGVCRIRVTAIADDSHSSSIRPMRGMRQCSAIALDERGLAIRRDGDEQSGVARECRGIA